MRTLALLAVLFGAGCSDPAPPRRNAPARVADKAALYADPGLLPTREGERARAEVALAGEIEASVELLHAVEDARASVTIGDAGTAQDAVVVVRTLPNADRTALEDASVRIATSVLSLPKDRVDVQVSQPATVTTAPTSGRPSPLLLFAILGLGISLGLSVDRLRPLLRRSVRRARVRRPTHPGKRR